MPTTTDLAGRLAQIVALQQEVLTTASSGDSALMTLVTDRLIDIANATGGVIELIHGEDLVYRAASGPVSRFVGIHIPLEASLSGTAIRERDVLLCTDTEHDPRVDLDACRDMNIRSMVVAPLIGAGGVLGVVKAYSDRKEHFDDLDSYSVQLVAGITAAALALSKQLRQCAASEERYRMLFDNNVAGVFRTTTDGRILDCNDAMVETFGFASREELLARSVRELYVDASDRDDLISRLKNERVMNNVHLRLKKKDGTPLAGLLNIGFIPDGDETQLIGTVVEE